MSNKKKLTRFVCVLLTVICVYACMTSCSDNTQADTEFKTSGGEFCKIGDTDLYYNTHTEEVSAIRYPGSKSSIAINLHYKNYILRYSSKYDTFYYYDADDNIVKLSFDEIEQHPDLSAAK